MGKFDLPNFTNLSSIYTYGLTIQLKVTLKKTLSPCKSQEIRPLPYSHNQIFAALIR